MTFLKFVVLVCFSTACGTFAWAASSSAPASSVCSLGKKALQLAMDQRDEQRLVCLKEKAPRLSVDQCLTIANTLEYSNNAEEARLICLYDLKRKIRFNDCSKIARAMEYADSGDEVRWECLREVGKITRSQCRFIAKKMSYPANQQRAESYCAEELR